MNSIPAHEVKRRGVAALEDAAKDGPVHVIKNSRPALVVLTPAAYSKLVGSQGGEPARNAHKTVWRFLREAPSTGRRTKKEIDAWLRAERASWGDR